MSLQFHLYMTAASVKSYLMAELRCWISSLSVWTSSCSWALSCCILLMYFAVFCRVVALLICTVTQRDYNSSNSHHIYSPPAISATVTFPTKKLLLNDLCIAQFPDRRPAATLLFDAGHLHLSAHSSGPQLPIFSLYLYARLGAEGSHEVM